MSPDPERQDARQLSADGESIRSWAGAHDARPFRRGSHFHLLPDGRATANHEPIEWEEFLVHVKDGDRVVIYHGEMATDPFEIVSRREAISRSNVDDEDLRARLEAGSTVTTTLAGREDASTVTVDGVMVEAEPIDSELTDDRVIDVELLTRECTDVRLEDADTRDDRGWFDADRYLESVDPPRSSHDTTAGATPADAGTGDQSSKEAALAKSAGAQPTSAGGETVESDPSTTDPTESPLRNDDATDPRDGSLIRTSSGESLDPDAEMHSVDREYPYTARLVVEELWSVTREVTERYTVESRVTGSTESNAARDEPARDEPATTTRDVDVDALQRAIATNDVLGLGVPPEQLDRESSIRTEFPDDDRIHTHVSRSRVVEDEVIDRQQVETAVMAAADPTDFHRIESTTATTDTPEDMAATGEDSAVSTSDGALSEADETASERHPFGDSSTTDDVTVGPSDSIPLSGDEVGMTVVDADGETIGLVSDVDPDGTKAFVDPDPGIAAKIKAALEWGDADEDDYPVAVDQIDHVTQEEIVLKDADSLESISSPSP